MPTITALPTPPSRSAPSTFSALAEAWIAAFTGTTVTEVNAALTYISASLTSIASSVSAAAASATAALASQNAAATSVTNAATQVGLATTQVSLATSQVGLAADQVTLAAAQVALATTKANAAAASLTASQSVNSNYLSPKAADPSVNDVGGALTAGLLYFNTATGKTRVFGGAAWGDSGSALNATSNRYSYTATAWQTTFAATYDIGFIDVYLNGAKLDPSDFTATSGTSVVLASGAAAGAVINIVAFGTFTVSTSYSRAEVDAITADMTKPFFMGQL